MVQRQRARLRHGPRTHPLPDVYTKCFCSFGIAAVAWPGTDLSPSPCAAGGASSRADVNAGVNRNDGQVLLAADHRTDHYRGLHGRGYGCCGRGVRRPPEVSVVDSGRTALRQRLAHVPHAQVALSATSDSRGSEKHLPAREKNWSSPVTLRPSPPSPLPPTFTRSYQGE